MTKTVTIAGREYHFAPITVDQAEQAQLAAKNGLAFNRALVQLSLQAAGDQELNVGATSYFDKAENSFTEYLAAALEVNGLKVPTRAGEEEPAAPAA